MAWIETVTPSFRARHASRETREVEQMLDSLERLRDHLGRLFPRSVGELTVVIHDSQASLSAARPLLKARTRMIDPAMRPYIAGWVSHTELHVLSPRQLAARATNVTGSREMLALSADVLYARRVILENNPDLSKARAPKRLTTEFEWAWLLEGSARWFAGQTDHARAMIARRLQEGRRPTFPPDVRDAPLLGGTVFDLLAREEGTRAAAVMATRLHPEGPRAALSKAFAGRALVHTEGNWHAHLARLADPATRR